MKKGLLSIGIIRNLRIAGELPGMRGICPVCGRPLKLNLRTGKKGQWAHFIRDTDFHIRHYGKEIVGSRYNGITVCDLDCNNAVQLTYASRPVLCDELAEDIRARIAADKENEGRFREACCG